MTPFTDKADYWLYSNVFSYLRQALNFKPIESNTVIVIT